MWQYIVHKQGGTVGHSSRPAAGAKGAAFAAERHQLLVMASLTPDPEKTMLKSAGSNGNTTEHSGNRNKASCARGSRHTIKLHLEVYFCDN